jgi:hypothetical protein
LFKRPAFAASPGSPVFWDAALQDFFDADIWQDALSVAYTGVENKFNPVVRTVIYKDVLTFSESDFENYKQVYDSGNWDSLTAEEKTEFDAYVNNPKEADAQGVVTLDFYRNYLISIGRWDADKQEKAYHQQVRIAEINQELRNNPTNSQELIREKTNLINSTGLSPFPPLKLGHFGPTERDPKQVALHKFSLIPMIPSVVEGRQMEKQMVAMYNGQVNYFTFKSGSKMSDNAEPSDFYEKVTRNGVEYLEVKQAIDDSLVTTIHIENLREQQYQAPKYKEESTLATQMMKLLFGDFYEFGTISQDFSPETQARIGNLYSQFTGQLNNLVQFETIKLEKKLGITRTNGVIEDINQLQLARFIAEQFEEKEVSDGLRNYIKVDDAGNFVNPLDANNDRAEIESLILNIFNNKIISQKINGDSFIQVAGTGLERLRFANPTQEQLKLYGANSLKFYSLNPTTGETDPMEVMISFNPKKHGALLNLTYEGKRIGTLQTLNSILTSDTQAATSWKELHKDKLTMVGVRIPVQGFSSMEYAIVREFLDESAGAVMILPAQIVTKTGGDYDIDKLTFFMTALDESGEVIQREFDVQEYTDQLSRQKELKISAARLRAIQQEMRAETGENPIYQQRQDIKDDINDLNIEIDELLASINNLLVDKFVTQEEADVLVGIRKEKKQIARKFAELGKLDRENSFEALSILAEVRKDIKEVKSEIAVVDNFKKSLGNELINTIKGILKTGELYDSLTTPNNNNILTQYVTPGKKITSTDVFNPMTSWRIFLENILSKDALGIDAKINTLQKEFQRAGLTYTSSLFNSYYFRANRNAEGQIMLGGKKDALGENRISKVLSEFVNGHVDIANEDWIILLGLNEETSPLAHAMILAGTPVVDVLDFLKSDVVKLALTMSNRAEVHKKLSDIFVSKNSAILALIKNNIPKTGNKNLEKFVASIEAEIKTAGIKGSKPKLAIYIEKMLGIPTLSQFITNFNPNAELSAEDKAMRNIAYLLQFGVVVAQQGGLRELTSISDFNTTNYRTSFQSTDTVAKEGGLKENFNADAIDFMFNKSALAQFNVSGFVQEIMGKIYPLSDSIEVHETINTFLDKNNIVGQEDRIKAIKRLKTNLLFNYTQKTATNEKGNLLDYYRGKNGVMQKTNPNNLAKRFEVLISDPDFNRNYVVQNLYPEIHLSGEINFKLKNVVVPETNKLYRTAFLEGLNSSIPEVKEFFTDLALGSFMQYGGHFNTDNVSAIVPHEAYIEFTTKSHNELETMRKEEPQKFKSYLTLVRYSTKMFSTTLSPITTSIDFLARTNPEKLKTMRLQDSVVKSLITLERSVYSPQPTQSSTTAVKPEFLLNEETLSYFKSGVDQGIEAIKKQYEERLKNLEYLSKKTALSGITQDEYDKKVNYINAEYNKKISQVGKLRYRINLESARDIELAELKRKYEGTTQPSTQVQGINISTKSSDKLGRELTNPNWGAKNIMDIEAEYKANASKVKAPELTMEEALRYDMNLMYKLQIKKFATHPELVQEITDRGGVKFLEASEHTVGVKDSRWEGKGTNSNFIKVLIKSYQNSLKLTQTSAPTSTLKPKGIEVKNGIFVNEGAISKEEQLELFNYLKPFLEEQAAKTNKGKYASKMIGLGLRWDYKVNNPGRTAVNIPDVINPLNKPKYGYYTESINGQPLGEITNRFREIISKATGLDMSMYDGAIINLYDNDGLISTHNDVDESRSAINYPVIGVNLGGTGNFSIESRDGNPMELNLNPGTTYVFGVNGVNREVFHRTFPKIQSSFLPELTTKLDNKTYEPGSYRVTITMRRVMPIQQVSQSSTTVQRFQGYQGGFENTGKGTPQGDGKDKAMRQVADSGFIGELDTTTGKESSTLTSFNIMSRGATVALTDLNKASKQFPVIALKPTGTTVMLARNKELSNKPLAEKTKSQILSAKTMGKQFVVGDMPGVDSQFIDYLQEIGAKFTIYHTGATPRIQVSQSSTNPNQNDINNLPNINPCG